MIQPEDLFHQIITQYQTTDPFLIAQKAGITVLCESWYPITFGEFSSFKRTITINQKSPIRQEIILAHELGHFFIFEKKIKFSRKEEEVFVEKFTDLFRMSESI